MHARDVVLVINDTPEQRQRLDVFAVVIGQSGEAEDLSRTYVVAGDWEVDEEIARKQIRTELRSSGHD